MCWVSGVCKRDPGETLPLPPCCAPIGAPIFVPICVVVCADICVAICVGTRVCTAGVGTCVRLGTGVGVVWTCVGLCCVGICIGTGVGGGTVVICVVILAEAVVCDVVVGTEGIWLVARVTGTTLEVCVVGVGRLGGCCGCVVSIELGITFEERELGICAAMDIGLGI